MSANRKLSRNASAVSVAPRPTPGIYLPLTTGRVRYSCLKEAAGEETSMQIQWCRRDEKDSGNRWWSNRSAGRIGTIVSLRAKLEAGSLVDEQRKRTRPVGAGRHRASEIGKGVSCRGSGEPGGRTELELGRSQSLEDYHGAATLGTAPKRARFLGSRCLLFYLRLWYRAE